MKEVEIEIPADAKTVTLELERHSTFTLRSLLPQAKCEVELVLEDVQGKCSCDRLRMKANCGQELLLILTLEENGSFVVTYTPEGQISAVSGRYRADDASADSIAALMGILG